MNDVQTLTEMLEGVDVIVVFMDSPAEWMQAGLAIERPRIVQLSDRLLLTGSVPKVQGDWGAGQKTGVAWSRVVSFLLFESGQDYEQRLSEYGGFGGASATPM